MQGVAFFRANFEMQIAQNSSSSTITADATAATEAFWWHYSF